MPGVELRPRYDMPVAGALMVMRGFTLNVRKSNACKGFTIYRYPYSLNKQIYQGVETVAKSEGCHVRRCPLFTFRTEELLLIHQPFPQKQKQTALNVLGSSTVELHSLIMQDYKDVRLNVIIVRL